MPSVIQSVVGRCDVDGQAWVFKGSHVGVQVCRSGKCSTTNSTIGTRYIPPGSTCVIEDGPGVEIKTTIHSEPPAGGGGSFCPK